MLFLKYIHFYHYVLLYLRIYFVGLQGVFFGFFIGSYTERELKN